MDNNFYDQEPQSAPQTSDMYQQQPYQNQPYPNQPYTQPQGYYSPGDLEEPVSVKEWMFCLLISMIPCVNIIMLFVWAFGGGKKSRSNFFKAELLFTAIVFAIIIVIFILCTMAGVALFSFNTDFY